MFVAVFVRGLREGTALDCVVGSGGGPPPHTGGRCSQRSGRVSTRHKYSGHLRSDHVGPLSHRPLALEIPSKLVPALVVRSATGARRLALR
jgi:hypothetical protein